MLPIFITTTMLLHSLKQVLWKKSVCNVSYFRNIITMLLISKIYNEASTSIIFFKKFYLLIAFLSLYCYECPTFFFINGIFKTRKFPGGTFLLRAGIKHDFCFYKLFQISENKNTKNLTSTVQTMIIQNL